MENKKAYILYKNHNLMMLLGQNDENYLEYEPSKSSEMNQASENSNSMLF
jgi:hypothetical protein